MAALNSANYLAEMAADKEKQKSEREARLKREEERLRAGFRNVTDYIVTEAHEEGDETEEETVEAAKSVKKAAVVEDMSEYDDEPIDGDESGEGDSDEGDSPSASPDGFTYAFLPKFINDLQVWGGVGYFNYRMQPKEHCPRRDELRALRTQKKATLEQLEELDILNELLEKIENSKQEIIKAGKLTKNEEKQLAKALQKYLEVKKFKISPETTLLVGFAAPMLRMGVAVERVKSELGV